MSEGLYKQGSSSCYGLVWLVDDSAQQAAAEERVVDGWMAGEQLLE
jgi:hypothetical protein